jgi:hypothetical protein
MASQPNPTGTLTQTAEAPGEFLWNDSGNADQLALMYGRDLLYCVERKAYYTWDGARWMYDDFRTVEGMAERTLLYMRAHAAKIELAQRRDRQLRRVVIGIQRLLMAVRVDALTEITLLIQKSNAVHRNTQVAGSFHLIAGDFAETTRVNWQGAAQHEFHAEVRDRCDRRVGIRRLKPMRTAYCGIRNTGRPSPTAGGKPHPRHTRPVFRATPSQGSPTRCA